ncbi:hypothetical protein, partial [Streptomyces pseudogriseolus]|uniref:hypothetical protein n=1 Tax=Streptomyces pseudogriseolus TaxID=36817 RepID=UPI00348CB130
MESLAAVGLFDGWSALPGRGFATVAETTLSFRRCPRGRTPPGAGRFDGMKPVGLVHTWRGLLEAPGPIG